MDILTAKDAKDAKEFINSKLPACVLAGKPCDGCQNLTFVAKPTTNKPRILEWTRNPLEIRRRFLSVFVDVEIYSSLLR